jgi:hypothetical protein
MVKLILYLSIFVVFMLQVQLVLNKSHMWMIMCIMLSKPIVIAEKALPECIVDVVNTKIGQRSNVSGIHKFQVTIPISGVIERSKS